jgi:hypothetical protein
MALALVLMAGAHLLAAVALSRAVRRVADNMDQLQRDMRPLVEKATRVADDATRVTAMAVVQAERIDALLRTTAARVDETFALVQHAVTEPIRQGTAILAAIRAAFAAVRAWQGESAPGAPVREDEDPLFVG